MIPFHTMHILLPVLFPLFVRFVSSYVVFTFIPTMFVTSFDLFPSPKNCPGVVEQRWRTWHRLDRRFGWVWLDARRTWWSRLLSLCVGLADIFRFVFTLNSPSPNNKKSCFLFFLVLLVTLTGTWMVWIYMSIYIRICVCLCIYLVISTDIRYSNYISICGYIDRARERGRET